MKGKAAFVSDFDGTITGDDFFAYASEAFFDEKSLTPWRRFKKGEITHFEALKEMFEKIRVSCGEFNAFMDKIPVDGGFAEGARICREKNMPVYICSAGCDYYINYLIGNIIEKYGVTLVANRGSYSPKPVWLCRCLLPTVLILIRRPAFPKRRLSIVCIGKGMR